MGLIDILNGMQNGPRGPSQANSNGKGGGMSPIMMALLGLVGLTAIWIPVLSPAIWLTVVVWHLTLAAAAVAALPWDMHREGSESEMGAPLPG